MTKKILLLGLLGGIGWIAWESRTDVQRYLRLRAM
ncbi:DUF6893 family small protein [Actinomycetospora sp. NBC_00405]